MAINIMQKIASNEDPVKGIKIPGTGLVLYPGGIEKTPTGLGNAFSESGLTADDILAYAKKYNLPTTSNKDFQQAQYDLLNSTERGRNIIKSMEVKYGKPKAGTYIDNILGARTLDMMMATPNKPEEYIPFERRVVIPKLPSPFMPNVTPNPKPEIPIETKPRVLDEEDLYFYKHGHYPNKAGWGDYGSYGGPGGYDKNGNPPKWYNFRRYAQRNKLFNYKD
jgi:hypothetical protein